MIIFTSKYRQVTHYSLIACALVIQLIVAFFLYNEYFNEKELNAIQTQMQETRELKRLIQSSRNDLTHAQTLLFSYTQNKSKKDLLAYFKSIQSAKNNLNTLKEFEQRIQWKKIETSEKEALDLESFHQLIDSVYHLTENLTIEDKKFDLKEIEVKNDFQEFKVEVIHSEDSLPKKKFFPRLKDAVKGKVDVKVDTVFITTVYGQSVNAEEIQKQMDSTVQAIESHYRNEMRKYENHLSQISGKNTQISRIYENLIDSGNGLMLAYDGLIDGLQSDLEDQFYHRNSVNLKIRRATIIGLLTMTFLMLLALIFYTRESFKLEKALKSANDQVKGHLQFKNRILGMLSHEIRSPLKIMNIFIGKIDRQVQQPKVNGYLKSMKFTNDSLLLQANQILEYTKNEQKKLTLEEIEFNLRHFIQEITDSFQVFIEAKGNHFETNVEIDAALIIVSDSPKIHQIFANILGNANKFTENGKIQLHAFARMIGDKRIGLKVKISDTGMGISEQDLQYIFEPYYQGALSEKVQNLGVGLGLNLCKELVALFDGELKVESELGVGTTVEFEIFLNKQNLLNDGSNFTGR